LHKNVPYLGAGAAALVSPLMGLMVSALVNGATDGWLRAYGLALAAEVVGAIPGVIAYYADGSNLTLALAAGFFALLQVVGGSVGIAAGLSADASLAARGPVPRPAPRPATDEGARLARSDVRGAIVPLLALAF
jgi:hypothetical protein